MNRTILLLIFTFSIFAMPAFAGGEIESSDTNTEEYSFFSFLSNSVSGANGDEESDSAIIVSINKGKVYVTEESSNNFTTQRREPAFTETYSAVEIETQTWNDLPSTDLEESPPYKESNNSLDIYFGSNMYYEPGYIEPDSYELGFCYNFGLSEKVSIGWGAGIGLDWYDEIYPLVLMSYILGDKQKIALSLDSSYHLSESYSDYYYDIPMLPTLGVYVNNVMLKILFLPIENWENTIYLKLGYSFSL